MPVTGIGSAATVDPVASLVSSLNSATTALTASTASSLQKSSNLSDLVSAATARTNLGLAAAATMTTAQIAADSALTNTFASLPLLSSMTTPYTVVHNGTSNIVVRHTYQAYDYAFAVGLPILDIDARVLADGTLANIHDATVDAETSSTGNVVALNAVTFKQLTVDPSSYLAAGYTDTTPTLVSDVLARYGTGALYVVEAKDGTTATVQKIVNLATSLGLKRNVIVESTSLSSLAPAVSAGMATLQVTNSPDTAAIIAASVTGVVLLATTSSVTISACVSAGLTTLVYGVQRRYEHAQMAALSLQGIFSDDPLYSPGSAALATTDSFSSRVWMPGHIVAANSRGTLISGGKLQFGVGQNASALLGFLCPVANAASSYQIDWTWTYDAIGASASAYPFLHIGEPDDRAYPNNISSGGYADGWRLQLQQNGTLAVFKTDRAAGTATNPVANVGATAPTDGVSVAMRVNVSPTQVVLTIPAQSKTVTVTDSSFRGGYIHCGQNGLAGGMQTSLSGITIT